MKIKGIETINFRNLKNNHPYIFDGSNFIVILGPNEAGKTSILEAIEMGLFARVDKHKEPDFMTWGKTEKPVIRLRIEKDGKDILIERNFQDGKSYMRGSGIDLKDDKRIRSKIEEILGFNDPDTFRNLLTIKQNEMIDVEPNSIQNEIDTLMTGGVEGYSVTEILNLLNSKLSANRDRFIGDDGKVYKKIQDELGQLNTHEKELLKKIEDSELKRMQLEEIKRGLEIDIKNKESMQRIYRWLDSFIPYEEAVGAIEALRNINAKIDVLEKDINETEKSVTAKRDRLKIYREFKEKSNDLKLKENGLPIISERLKAIDEKVRLINEIGSYIKGKEIPSKDELNRFKELNTMIQQLESSLESQAVVLDVEALINIEVIVSDTENVISSGQSHQFEIKNYKERLAIKDVANITVTNRGLSAVSENLNIYQQQIKEMIYKFDISSVKELEERYLKNSENERLSMEIKGLLQGDTIEGIRERLGLLNSEIKDIKEAVDKLAKGLGDSKSLEVEDAILEEEEKRLTITKKELVSHKIKKAKILGKNAEEDLIMAKMTLELNLTKMEITDREKDSLITLSLTELKDKRDEISKELEQITERVNDNREMRARLEGELKNIPPYEELVSVQEKIAELERQKEKSDILLKSLVALEDNLKEASEKTRDFIKTRIDELSSLHFYNLTCGKYDNVEVFLGNEISIRVKEAGSDEFREVTNTERRLSTGAIQQLYFATRLALIDILTGNRKLPLILDDPFVDFDSNRLKEALDILKSLSKAGYQCLLFTCHERMTEGSEMILTL